MEINDYLKIANEYADKHNKDENFVLMGLYKLIQDTDLHRTHAHSLLSQQGDGTFGLTTPQGNPIGNSFTTLSKISKNNSSISIFSVDKENSNPFRDTLFGNEEDHELVRKFNDDLQNVENLFDLKDVYTFDEITRIKHLTAASVSVGLALELISQNNESFETGKYNAVQNSYINQASFAEDKNYGKSQKFEFFSNDPLCELISINTGFPLTPDTFFTELNTTAQSKIVEMSGFGHITFIEEDFQDLINNDALFIKNSFVGSLFTLDSFRDVMISYFNYNELDDLKFEFSLMSERFLSNPTIENLLTNDDMFSNLDDMLMDVYAKHPELNYSVQNISIISDRDYIKHEVIEHQVDKFHFYETFKDIHNLGPNQNDRRMFLSKYKLYGEDILKHGDDRIRFISSNQFAADAILSATVYMNETVHNEIIIDSIAINPQLSDEHITDLLESVVDYAQKHKSVLMIKHEKKSPWGGINKDRFMDLVSSVAENAADRVPLLSNFGVDNDRHHFALNYLVNTEECSYQSLPKLFNELKKFIDSHQELDDLQLELKMDEFIIKERIKLKSENKASI